MCLHSKRGKQQYQFSHKVSSDVTPNVALAGIASGLIQKEIQDITTINPEGI
jgi:hypothetical protein